MKYNVILMLF